MRERGAIVVGSALAAAAIGYACILAVVIPSGVYEGAIRDLLHFSFLAIMPAATAAALSAAWVVRRRSFARRRDLRHAVGISFLAFPFLYLLLWPVFWIWLRFHEFLPTYERPEGIEALSRTAFGWAVVAFVVAIVPAICIEYFVIRFVRKRWSPALAPGVSP